MYLGQLSAEGLFDIGSVLGDEGATVPARLPQLKIIWINVFIDFFVDGKSFWRYHVS